jgi:hypothetical protein
MPMPIDLLVAYEDGSEELFYIPLQMMRGEKEVSGLNIKRTVLNDWAWAYPTYSFEIQGSKKVKKLMIDPSQLMADIDLTNNSYIIE